MCGYSYGRASKDGRGAEFWNIYQKAKLHECRHPELDMNIRIHGIRLNLHHHQCGQG